jgi:Fe-Mn family superoxide dismutase
MFWEIMGPKAGGKPSGPLADDINRTFNDFAAFQAQIKQAGIGRFGSGWAWLVLADGKLQVLSTPNQDSPYMNNQTPILGVDVWEHAYYLKYQNKRPDYLDAWWNVVNWTAVAQRYSEAKAGKVV